jgi:hypothetical protein
MKKTTRVCAALFCVWLFASSATAQDNQKAPASTEKARVFITDSQSWETRGGGGGSSAGFGGASSGGARPQTAEIIKTFGERCPEVLVNNIQDKTDYVVVLDHEGGKSVLAHRNKVAVFGRISGDSVVSKSTLSLGGSVQTACEAIEKDWAAHGPDMRAAAVATQPRVVVAQSPPPAVSSPVPATAKLSVSSVPDGADIELDGSFAGNTPSDIDVAAGEHTVSVKKSGFQPWERKLKVTSGSNVRLKAEMEKTAN